MRKIVLIGSNIEHSRSPAIHNRLFEMHGLPYRYELLPAEPNELPDIMRMLRDEGYRGGNVTSPHKELVYELLDERSETAERLGAVNTFVIEEGKALGYNTDTVGFEASLERRSIVGAPFTAAVLGTGGAARAAVDVLLRHRTLRSLTLYSRSGEKAGAICTRWRDDRLFPAAYEEFEAADLIVHATPVGLAGEGGRLLEPEQLEGGRMLYDMIYHPDVTRLMEAAADAGLAVLGGREMFIGQALESFRLWTGVEVRRSDLPPIPGL